MEDINKQMQQYKDILIAIKTRRAVSLDIDISTVTKKLVNCMENMLVDEDADFHTVYNDITDISHILRDLTINSEV